jgi:hypothetical protein
LGVSKLASPASYPSLISQVSLKQKIENNLTLSILSLLFTGFVAGLATYKGLLSLNQGIGTSSHVVNDDAGVADPEIVRKQLDELLAFHSKRVDQLQASLLECEKGATNTFHTESDQQKSAEAAKRLSGQLAEENRSFLEQLKAMRAIPVRLPPK